MAGSGYKRNRYAPGSSGSGGGNNGDEFSRNKDYWTTNDPLYQFKDLERAAKKISTTFDKLSETLSKSNYDKLNRDVKKQLVDLGVLTKEQSKQIKTAEQLSDVIRRLEMRFKAIESVSTQFKDEIQDLTDLMVETAQMRGEAVNREEIAEKARLKVISDKMKLDADEVKSTEAAVKATKSQIVASADSARGLKSMTNAAGFVTRQYIKQALEMATFTASMSLLKRAIQLGWDQANDLNRRGLLGAMMTIHGLNTALDGLKVPIEALADSIERNRAFINQMGGGNKGITDFLGMVKKTKDQLWFLGKDAGLAAIRFRDMAREAGTAKITDENGNVDPKRIEAFNNHMDDVVKDFRKFRASFNMTADQFADMNEQLMTNETVQDRLHGLQQDQIFAIQKEQLERARNLKYMGLSTDQVIKFNRILSETYDPKKVNIVDMNKDSANLTQSFYRMIQDVRQSKSAEKNPELYDLADKLEKHAGSLEEYRRLIASGASQQEQMKFEDEHKDMFRDYAALRKGIESKLRDQEKAASTRYAEDNFLHEKAMKLGTPLADAKTAGKEQADPTTEEGRRKIYEIENANRESEGTTKLNKKGEEEATFAAKALHVLGEAVNFITTILNNPFALALGATIVGLVAFAKWLFATTLAGKARDKLLDNFDPDGMDDRKKKRKRGRGGKGKGGTPGMPEGKPGNPTNTPVNPAPGAPEGGKPGTPGSPTDPNKKPTDSPDKKQGDKMEDRNKEQREKLANDREKIKADRGRVRMLGILGKGLGLLSLGVAAWDAHEVYEDYKNDKMTESQLAEEMGEEIASAAAGGIAGFAGTTIGALLGMPLGPVGMAVGGAAGGAIGGWLGSRSEAAKKDGRAGGGWFGDKTGATDMTYSQKQQQKERMQNLPDVSNMKVKNPQLSLDLANRFQGSEKITGLNEAQTRALAGNTAATESSGRANIETNRDILGRKLGYTGKYQFGAEALSGLGLIDQKKFQAAKGNMSNEQWMKSGAHYNFMSDPKNWKIEGGRDAFLKNEKLQDDTFVNFTNQNIQTGLKSGALKPNDPPEKFAQFAKMAHLGGAGGAVNYFKNGGAGGNITDGSTSRREYGMQGIAAIQLADKVGVDKFGRKLSDKKVSEVMDAKDAMAMKSMASETLTTPSYSPNAQSVVKVPGQFDWSKAPQAKVTPPDQTAVANDAIKQPTAAQLAQVPQAMNGPIPTDKSVEMVEMKKQTDLLTQLVRATVNGNRTPAPNPLDRASYANGIS